LNKINLISIKHVGVTQDCRILRHVSLGDINYNCPNFPLFLSFFFQDLKFIDFTHATFQMRKCEHVGLQDKSPLTCCPPPPHLNMEVLSQQDSCNFTNVHKIVATREIQDNTPKTRCTSKHSMIAPNQFKDSVLTYTSNPI
jgi:hypothetical protein